MSDRSDSASDWSGQSITCQTVHLIGQVSHVAGQTVRLFGQVSYVTGRTLHLIG
jgi:hypothetical protein